MQCWRLVSSIAVLVLVLAACAPHAVEQPVLSLGNQACDPQPVLQSAVAIPFGASGGVVQTLDGSSRCLAIASTSTPSRTTYVVFRLPDAPAPYDVTVSSLVDGIALVSPRLTIDDAAGVPGRVVEPRDFVSGIEGLQAGLRTRPGERYLVVAANPVTLGQEVTLRLSLEQRLGLERDLGVQLASAGPIFIPIFIPPASPPISERPATLSLNGRIRVTARPIVLVR